MFWITLISTLSSSGIETPSLTVDDSTSLEPNTSLITLDDDASELRLDDEEEFEETPEAERFEDSRAELNPDGVSTSAMFRKFGSPRSWQNCSIRILLHFIEQYFPW